MGIVSEGHTITGWGPDGELETLFRLSLDMLCLAGTDGYFKRVNPAFETTLGRSQIDLLNSPFIDFVHPDDREGTLDAVGKLIGGGTVAHFENRYRCGDGSYRWLSWTSVPGNAGHIYAVARDVTEEKASQAQLRESRERYRQLLEAVSTYTYTVEVRDGRSVRTAHGGGSQSVTGYSALELESDSWLWFRMIHADDREKVREMIAVTLQNKPVPPIEHRIIHKNGRVRWLRDTIVRHCEAGRLVRYDGVVQDVTDRRRVEERLRSLVEFAVDAIVVADGQGRIVQVNRQTESLFGYRREELLGLPIEILVPDRLRAGHVAQRGSYLAGPSFWPMAARDDLPGRKKDGREFPAAITLSPIVDDGETLVYASVRDMTELRAAQRRNLDNEVQQLASQRIQRRLLPKRPPELGGFDIAGASYPAALTGGDMYDYLTLGDGSLGLAIGDVSGHGIAAALMMASTHAYLRVLASTRQDVGTIVSRTNSILCDEMEESRFVTLLLCRLSVAEHLLTWCNAGHPSGYVLDAEGEVCAELRSGSYPLGIASDEIFPPSGPVRFRPGDLLLLTTDGVLEARSPDGEQFGADRMLQVVRTNRLRAAAEIVDAVCQSVRTFSASYGTDDDMTLLIVKHLGDSASLAMRPPER